MITLERLKELLEYNPDTGVFRWRIKRGKMQPGQIAGTVAMRGHVTLHLDYRYYGAHRLAWLYMTGKMPKHQIDHKDYNPGNNAFSNLREATNSQNHMNKTSKNSSGFKGVRLDKRRGKWMSNIKLDGKSRFLGYFDTPEMAYEAYVIAAKSLFGEFARVA